MLIRLWNCSISINSSFIRWGFAIQNHISRANMIMRKISTTFNKLLTFWISYFSSPSLSPDPSNDTYWPTFTVPEREYKVLNTNLTTGRALRADYCKFWNEVVPNIYDASGSQSIYIRQINWSYMVFCNIILLAYYHMCLSVNWCTTGEKKKKQSQLALTAHNCHKWNVDLLYAIAIQFKG